MSGLKKSGVCVCELNSTMWSFPDAKFEAVLQQVETCEGSLNKLLEQVGTHADERFLQVER